MIIKETRLKGSFLIAPEKIEDERGWFARSYCRSEFEKYGLNPELAQCSISFNKKAGTMRGMHFQVKPHEEAKLVRCTRGAIYDVIIDLRQDSETYGRWIAAELNEDNSLQLYIPEGLAHGFQTLRDNTEVFYQISEFFQPGSGSGVSWDDPAFAITWPLPVSVISEKDQNYPGFKL
jgi:dTDP-4-dehydrorhamnose 3,5-epimerase